MRRGLSDWIRGGFAAFALVGGLGMARAQAPAEELAPATAMARIVALAEIATLAQGTVEGVWPTIEQRLPAETPEVVRQELRMAYDEGFGTGLRNGIAEHIDAVLPDFATAISDALTVAEIEAWVGFYATSAGAHLLETGPQLFGHAFQSLLAESEDVLMAAITVTNRVLRQYGQTPFPVPDSVALPPAAPVLSALAASARTLVIFGDDVFAATAMGFASSFGENTWQELAAYLPGQPVPSEAVAAFQVTIYQYYGVRTATWRDEFAVLLTGLMAPDEIASAAAFHASPEAQGWIAAYPEMESLLSRSLDAQGAFDSAAMTQLLLATIENLNGILQQRGLAPIVI